MHTPTTLRQRLPWLASVSLVVGISAALDGAEAVRADDGDGYPSTASGAKSLEDPSQRATTVDLP